MSQGPQAAQHVLGTFTEAPSLAVTCMMDRLEQGAEANTPSLQLSPLLPSCS